MKALLKWLKYIINSPQIREQIARLASGTTRQRISGGNLKRLEIPLPPLAEQRRIVARLDELLAHAQRARAELARVPGLVERQKQAVLAQAFSGELTREWREQQGLLEPSVVALKSLVSDIRYGTAQKCDSEPKGVAVLRIPNIGEGLIVLNELKYAELNVRDYNKLRLIEGDILVIRSNGSADLVGRPAMVADSAVGLAYAGYLIRLRPITTAISSHFLTLMLRAPQIRNIIEVNARSTSGVHNVNSAELAALHIPKPSKEEQHEIVRRIESAFTRIERTAAEAARAAGLIERLEQATLARAFRGAL
ncbi:restriction endonuclease subunit S [Candidatus Viridilinea mediisalina]|uniref:Type I restriction modification DNA specificity domain-containing protein n=1 Tax=Candidatus Viridilinea mediisalina TaxID=2024553 RepID=A0A2A6RF29_9CHLR|nr:restriction endonuclease subunit S [Candidatus Viridilinea mediisalina]PDW01496.1 hypothetical protein CJ255_18875 [Candidatus Viridilinea mediisalina]